MEFSEQAVILQVGKMREADLWVRLLSPSRGVYSAFAFGGSRSRRRFVGCLDMFNRVLFRVEQSPRSQYLTLREGVLLQGPARLRTDWGRLGIAVNCAKFLQAFGLTPEGAGKAHALFCELLQALEDGENTPNLLPVFFRMRLAYDQGYAVNPSTCAECGKDIQTEGAYFSVRAGVLVCGGCVGLCPDRPLPMGTETLAVLRAVLFSPLAEWGRVAVSSRGRNECGRAIDGFIHYHVGLSWENGYFARS